MNRPAFLSTLPFLYELSSSNWPPLISEDMGKTRRQILFRDHYLSLEPLTLDSEGTLGPAYFVALAQNNNELFDAAMCKVEMVLFTTPKKTPFQVPRNTPAKSPGRALEMEFKESIAFLLIDDRIYQMDLGKIKNVELKALEAAGRNNKNQPPCLLMHYPHCAFRIFSLVGNDTDQYAILNTGKNEILSVINGDMYCPFPTKDSDLTSAISPMLVGTSSTTTNSEPGQQELALQHETARPSSEDTTNSRKNSGSKASSEMAVVDTTVEQCNAKTKKCRACLTTAREDLQSLRRLLKSPPPPPPPPQSSDTSSSTQSMQEIRTTASSLLTSVAENVGASFGCTQDEVVTAARGLDQEMDSYQSQLDTLLKTIWPANKRPKKRARGHAGKKRNVPPLPQDVQDASIDHVEMLLAKHKQALRSKYALAMLPTRG
ncbi:unnamed protein product [Cylindrotheca closterium]|uniref:Uncharacterized protein n=1 Tax=Cylindrotheca closterium TaxID=2856 RepID=A0AAD2FFB5_9STRA|nr:unnamed protein product [Cylindrotheca closterium]